MYFVGCSSLLSEKQRRLEMARIWTRERLDPEQDCQRQRSKAGVQFSWHDVIIIFKLI
jgi:hypothetical protein